MRAFLAIALPANVRTALADLQRQLAVSGADVKWVALEHLHVTLKFLDEISDEQRRMVEALLQRVAVTESPFTLSLTEVGAFPSLESPRVLWVGLGQGTAAVVRIAQLIERGTIACSLRREERPFAAHVTIGRVRSPRRREALVQRLLASAWHAPEAFQVTALTLYRSDLHPAGPQYTALAEIPLAPRQVDGP